MMNVRIATTLLTLALPQPVFAQTFQDPAAIDLAVVTATGAAIGQVGGAITPVDRRLKLAACPDILQTDAPVLGAIAIRCPARGWRIRVPLINAPAIAPASEPAAIIVKRGENLELRVKGSGFEVTSTAVALEDGANGKSIRVKLPTSPVPVVATVIGPSVVQILY
jgi:flagella basal body P-ring formation protein FlgA